MGATQTIPLQCKLTSGGSNLSTSIDVVVGQLFCGPTTMSLGEFASGSTVFVVCWPSRITLRACTSNPLVIFLLGHSHHGCASHDYSEMSNRI